MAMLTPQEFAEKQARRLKGATEDIRRGVERVKDAPGRKAAQKKEKMRQGIMTALDTGKWERNVAAVPLEAWRNDMLVKGIGRISQGIDNARAKTEAFAAQLIPFQERLKNEVDKMPDTTPEDRIMKAVAWMRGMQEFKKQ